MYIQTKGKTPAALLDLYNREIDTLKSRLLNGTAWEDLLITRENITNLTAAIHEECGRSLKNKLTQHDERINSSSAIE